MTPEQLHELRAEGAEQADLESRVMERERKYILLAYEVYPNGTTAEGFVENPDIANEIGRRMGIGAPDDKQGWAIWYVPKRGRK